MQSAADAAVAPPSAHARPRAAPSVPPRIRLARGGPGDANLVDAALSERFADALLLLDFTSGAVRLQGHVRVLLEHQSTPLGALD